MKTLPLGQVADFVRGITFKPSDVIPLDAPEAVACMRTKNVQVDIDVVDVLAVPKQFIKRAEQYLKEGDILVSSANSWNLVGKCSWVPALAWPATLGGFISGLRGKEGKVHNRYLYHWFSYGKTQELVRACARQTTNIANLNFDQCLALQIPLPSLDEQRRIAGILDQADMLRRQRKRALDRLNQLVQAIFYEMFGSKSKKRGQFKKISDVSSRVTKGESPKWQGHSYADSGALFVTSENVGWGFLTDKSAKFIPLKFHEKLKRSQLLQGDLLINLVGASIGRACLFKSNYEHANINQAVAVVSLDGEESFKKYLLSYILSSMGQSQILGSRVEGARANISLKDIRDFEFYMPNSSELADYSERVNTLSLSSEKMLNQFLQLSSLFASLQHHAFRREL
jgi:type I restriction enzyme S subunit